MTVEQLYFGSSIGELSWSVGQRFVEGVDGQRSQKRLYLDKIYEINWMKEPFDQEVDIAIGPMSASPDRFKVANFVGPTTSSDSTLLIKYPDTHISTYALLEPFNPLVWTFSIFMDRRRTLVRLG